MPPLKCPSPSCNFLFDPSKVPAGAVLECPRCRTRFSLAESAAPPTFGLTPGASAEKPPKGRSLASYLLPVFGVMIVVGGITAAILIWGGKSTPVRSNDVASETLNFAFTPPGSPWEADEEYKTNRLGVNVAVYRRAAPDAWVALAARDFEDRTPRRAELDVFIDERLQRVFDNLNSEEKAGATWAGRPAIRYEFRATAKGTDAVYVGEVYAMTNKGVAYWFFAWAPQSGLAKVHEEFDTIRERLRFHPGRENWNEAAPLHTVLTGKGYSLTDPEGVWTKSRTDPKDEDPKADLLADAVDAAKHQSAEGKPTARLVAFVLDGTGDPFAAARKYVEERHTRDPETFGPVAFEELTDAPQGEAAGETKSVRLKLTRPNSPSSSKLLVVTGIAVGDKVVAIEISCPWSQRGVWEKRLIALTTTLKMISE